MRSLLIAATTAALLAVAASADQDQLLKDFELFKTKFDKKYTSAAEESKRFKIFVENMQVAAKLNAQNPLANFGSASPYADMSAQEFKSRHNAEKTYSKLKSKAATESVEHPSAEELAAASGKSIDWRTKGAVTHVKNQGQCGSCWSFSTTGGVEGQWFLAGNTLTSLSEQLFVSCDTIDDGCQGGLMDNAFKWAIEDNGGNLVTAASYPYVSGFGQVPACDKSGKTFGAHITGYKNIPGNETEMAAWVFKNGPLSIAVDATTWQTYTGGIITNCANQQLDHGVLIVGFDETNQPPYWIIKNSWGPSWGEEGYLRVEMFKKECLITEYQCSSIVGATDAPTPMPPSPPVTPMPPSPPIKNHWIDLFQPPYEGVPTVTLAISCVDGTNCFVPGGQNNEGFDLFNFDGHRNGVFTPLDMPDKPFLMMAVGMGGTADKPHGCTGGFGIGSGIQYAANKTTFLNSFVPTLLVETQDIRVTSKGMDVIAILSTHVIYSNDGGVVFSEHAINSNLGPNKCAEGRYGAMVSDSEWFVTAGSWPEKNSNTKTTKYMSERVSMVNGKRISKNMYAQVQAGAKKGGDDSCGYTAVIAKTTDGGKTFTNVFEQLGNETDFYWNGIDCSSPTNCVAVGEGFNANAAGHIYHTENGKDFKEVLKLPSGQDGVYSLMSVRFKSANEVWVAGSKQASFSSTAVFMVSMDGGKTWKDESGTLNNIGDISMISFTPDGKHGFATAVTIYDDSTVLRYGAALPPAPPAPPTSGPTGFFIQEQCQDSACSQGCQNHTFQAGVCLPLNGGGSAIATCTPTTLEQRVYLESPSCTGSYKTSSMPLDQCLKDEQGTYFENFCSGNGPTPPSPPTPPTPPAPTSAPSSGFSLIQEKCSDSGCTSGCQNHTFPTGQCLPLEGGGSALVQCKDNTVVETIYQSSSDCSGSSQQGTMPCDQCLQANGGGYLENFCIPNGEAVGVAKGEALAQARVYMRRQA